METAATVTLVKAGKESEYRDWVASAEGAKLGEIWKRHGISARVELMTATQITHHDTPGTRVITHYEAKSRDGVTEAYRDPQFAKLVAAKLGELVDIDLKKPPALFEEIFAWSVPRPAKFETGGLIMTVQPGQYAGYQQWLAGKETLQQLITIWNRNEIYRHDVLALNGESLVAYYECANAYNVLKAFREPEALDMLLNELSGLLTLSPYVPMNLFTEISSWRV